MKTDKIFYAGGLYFMIKGSYVLYWLFTITPIYWIIVCTSLLSIVGGAGLIVTTYLERDKK